MSESPDPRWLLGLPFDMVDLSAARALIFSAVEQRRQLIFATPNVSFIAEAGRSPRFLQDILHTDLCLVDGKPLLWLGRLAGVRFTERVAGSDLLDSFVDQPGPRPLRVFFFGGEGDAAEAAMQAVNQRARGMIGVGAHNPGFVGIDAMSSDAVIDQINASQADLLVVALGAAKGHRWIEANRARLNVPVISHLGAAINFVSGRLQRAPGLLQHIGLEWVWRIREEPALYRRYLRDGIFLLKAVTAFLPRMIGTRLVRRRGAIHNLPSAAGLPGIGIAGRFTATELAAVKQTLPPGQDSITISLTRVTVLDAEALGWLYAHRFRGQQPAVRLQCDAASRSTLRLWRALPLLETP